MTAADQTYQWAIIGAGPAGLASLGLLLDAGVNADEVLWLDPQFTVGDFGAFWGEVHSNTTVELFLNFLTHINSFNFSASPHHYALQDLDPKEFTQLQWVSEPLQWVTDELRQRVNNVAVEVKHVARQDGAWQLQTAAGDNFAAKQVILATGASAKRLVLDTVTTIDLMTALKPSQLAKAVTTDDTVAVFGSSHSAMIIIRSLVELKVKKIINFYLSPLCFALNMGDWILYDNTGLKGETAAWVRANLSQRVLPNVERVKSTTENMSRLLPQCQKAISAIGFAQRLPTISDIDPKTYDPSNGIIAPGLFGAGIGFPRQVIDPNGRKELNVGLWKFYNDIKRVMPIWLRYGL